MTTSTPTVEADLQNWLEKQPVWLQHCAQSLVSGSAIGKEEIVRFSQMAISEARGTLAPPPPPPPLGSLGAQAGGGVALRSLSSVSGINQLNPRRPLEFGNEKLAVVYGPNGSGKSGYVRILKHACGTRQKGEIHPDVFGSTAVEQECMISFSDPSGPHSVAWSPSSGTVLQLSTIDIFDLHCGQSYLASETPPTYEPRPLVFLSRLASLCDQVAACLSATVAAKPKALPLLPPEHGSTTSGKWYAGLTAATRQPDVDANCRWTEQDQEEFDGLAKYLAETSPRERARELEVKKGFTDSLVASLKEHCAAYSDEACAALMALRRTARERQQTAELAAQANLKDAVLSGVGTKQWLDLWSIARTYSLEVAYQGKPFPFTDGDARCVLCQQELTPQARNRLLSFDQYVTNEAAAAAQAARVKLQQAIGLLPALAGAFPKSL